MHRFGPALRKVAAELDLPRRARTALLLELAADLEDVYEHYRAEGLGEAEAARRAEATVLASPEVIRRLGRLHVNPWQGWAEGVSATLRGGFDVVLLVVGVLPVLTVAIGVSIWVLAEHPSPLTGSVLLVGAVLVAVSAKGAVSLLRGRSPERAELPTILVVAAMALALGLFAPIVGVWNTVDALRGGAPAQTLFLTVVARDGATLLAALLLGVVGLLVWFVLLGVNARRAEREVAALLAENMDVAEIASMAGTSDSILPLVRRRHR